jgi:NADPH:quinone reductase-like Zn-dependent oxidoreductase
VSAASSTASAVTRNPGKAGAVTRAGADHVLIDDRHVARQVREILPGGADAALELVGTPTLPDTLRSVRVHGVVCFSGMLSNQWTVRDFYPMDYLPTGVRLTAAGTAAVPIGRVYRLDQIVAAHTDMEQNRARGKLVVTT